MQTKASFDYYYLDFSNTELTLCISYYVSYNTYNPLLRTTNSQAVFLALPSHYSNVCIMVTSQKSLQYFPSVIFVESLSILTRILNTTLIVFVLCHIGKTASVLLLLSYVVVFSFNYDIIKVARIIMYSH